MAKLSDVVKNLQDNTVKFHSYLLSKPKERVVFRQIKTKDQKQLTIDKEENETSEYENFITLLNLVDACLIQSSVNLGDFTLQDFISLLLDIKIKSQGQKLELVATCPHCKTKNDITLDCVADVKKTVLDKPLVDNVIQCSDNLKITIGHVTVEDFLHILEFEKEEARKIASLASMIKGVELNGETVDDISSIDHKIAIVEELSKEQLQKFKEFEEKNPLDLKAEKTYKCIGKDALSGEECGKENIVTMTGLDVINFF